MSILNENIEVTIRGTDVLTYASNHKAYSICDFNLTQVLLYLNSPISNNLDWWLGLAKAIHHSPGKYKFSVYSYPNRMGITQITEVNIQKLSVVKAATKKIERYESWMNTMFISDIKYKNFLTPICYQNIEYEIKHGDNSN